MKHSGEGFCLPDLLLFAGTRVTLGMGIGLLLARRMNNDQRKAAGGALAAVSAFVTIPLAMRAAAMRQWRREHARQGGCSCACDCCQHHDGCKCECPCCREHASPASEQHNQTPPAS